MKEQINHLKEMSKDMDLALEEHFPFPAHYSLTPGVDSYEVKIFTQGKRGILEYSKVISIEDFENTHKRGLFINSLLNRFKEIVVGK